MFKRREMVIDKVEIWKITANVAIIREEPRSCYKSNISIAESTSIS